VSTHAVDLSALDNQQLATLVGSLDEHLNQIAQSLQVQIKRRGSQLRLIGDTPAIDQAGAVIQTLVQQLPAVDRQAVFLALVQQGANDLTSPSERVVLKTRRADVGGRTPNQQHYVQLIQRHDLVFGLGPAGTGKTYLAVACAVDALERAAVQKIILTRPAVEAGERLGFLPGDLAQKVDPYLRPLYDALHDLMGIERVTKAFERQVIEIAPLAYMRGRTLNDAFVILDEAQNTTTEQMKMFLTRLGYGSKMVVNGDPSQVDLPRGQRSGLLLAHQLLRQVPQIGFALFDAGDIVRHPLVSKIVQAFEQANQQGQP
jgi:phosphate starvation-inducible protein PhoH and related proteins